MKAYQYNESTGLFEGAIYAERDTLQYISGITTIAPPEHEEGIVPVFDTTAQRWEQVSLTVARQLLLGRSQ